MRKKLLIIVGVLAAIFVVLLIVIAMQPGEFRIARSITIAAPPEAVFEHINDLHKWQAWSPWAKKDPNAKATFEGPETGKGSKFHWAGNDQVGEGSMTISESVPAERVKFLLEFKKPFEDTSTAEFHLKPEGDKTTVTWSMYGEQQFIEKAFCLLMDMDAMLGADFNQGLTSLKGIVEGAKPEGASPAKKPGEEEPAK